MNPYVSSQEAAKIRTGSDKTKRPSIVMRELPANPSFWTVRRAAAYALLAAFVTAGLLAAESAYRWHRDASVEVAGSNAAPPAAPAQPGDRDPASASLAGAPETEATASADAVAEDAISGSVQTLQGDTRAVAQNAVPAAAANSAPETPVPSAGRALQDAMTPLPPRRPQIGNAASKQAEPRNAAPRQTLREPAAPRRATREAARPPARPAAPQRAAAPNVYFEREADGQLGFAPQLRRRTCDAASGNMPMQCYYPRQGREQFPAKPVN